jgi:uncharacterized membrane protein
MVVSVFLDFSYILGTMTWISGVIVLATVLRRPDSCNTEGNERRQGVEYYIYLILMLVHCFGEQ